MALTAARIDTIITNLESALNTALDNPKPNYKIGGRSVNHADYIAMLSKQLLEYQGMAAAVPSESTVDLDYEINEQGTDDTQLEGDSDIA